METDWIKLVCSTAPIGALVTRGRDWNHGEQDLEGIECKSGVRYGEIVENYGNGWVGVIWGREGIEWSYKAGYNGLYDLYYADGDVIEDKLRKDFPQAKSSVDLASYKYFEEADRLSIHDFMKWEVMKTNDANAVALRLQQQAEECKQLKNKLNKNEKAIVSRITPIITEGQRNSGNTVFGKIKETRLGIGHLSNATCVIR